MKKSLIIAGTVLALGLGGAQLVNASSTDSYALRYFESYKTASDSDGDTFMKIGYVDHDGKSRVLVKHPENVNEYITDTSNVHVTNTKRGETAEVVRSPYQVFDAGEKSSDVTVVGWSDFTKAYPKVIGKTLKVKWYDAVTIDQSTIPVIEFVYNGHLYRMYMPDSSLGAENFDEDVSPSYTTPTLSFGNKFAMTYHRAPFVSYVQPAKSGKVVEK